ncbi:hypothetical protein D4A39_10440 [Alcanivorax profundi]|uniref:Yip1 domain-containing protein n=1 Tax=Alcanivorax profundi TaxID=2338368 RepID=A0A418XWE8_9GAMM|nr:hypothetical protein [Alcanivorax profundi]RJG17148.1 hypothetical protein D4A39_10440 [Alcanivorax profundi]
MNALITLFWRLAIFRASPEHTPYSQSVFALVLLLWSGLQLLVGLLQQGLPASLLLGSQWIALTVLLGGTFMMLAFKGLGGRWLQTATSLVGVDVVLSLANLPLLLSGWLFGPGADWVQVFILLLVSWQLAAQAFIFHRALNVGPFLGLGIAMALLVASYGSVAVLLPAVMAPAG